MICCLLNLSRGSSSVVRRCIEKETAREYAVKIIDLEPEDNDQDLIDQIRQETMKEIYILRMCSQQAHISKSGSIHFSKPVSFKYQEAKNFLKFNSKPFQKSNIS